MISFIIICFLTIVLGYYLLHCIQTYGRLKAFTSEAYDKLNGKVVVITGASSGLGEALARIYYQHGCRVILVSRRLEELQRVRNDLLQSELHHFATQSYNPEVALLDLSTENVETVHATAQMIIAIHGRVDVLINNAGVSSRASVIDTNIDVDRRMMFVNYLNQIALTKVVLRSMLGGGGDGGGSDEGKNSTSTSTKKSDNHRNIVAISSVQGRFAIPERSAYSASKHALQAFYDSLRAELYAKKQTTTANISITVISPGYIRTNLSLNALTSDGTPHGQMDSTTAAGLDPRYVAQQILEASSLNEEPELVIAPALPRLMIVLRAIAPSAYFWIMGQYAKRMGH